MRGQNTNQSSFLYSTSTEERVPQDHPLRDIKELADDALAAMSDTFEGMYSQTGRSSVPPERLFKSLLLIALYSIRSERQFCEQLEYNLLFRWFLGMDMVERSFNPSTFSHNRARLIRNEATRRFLLEVCEIAKKRQLLSQEHFRVDGTLIEAWASMKSFQPKGAEGVKQAKNAKDSNGWASFKGQKRSNRTHESQTDPEAKLMRKGAGKAAKLSFCGNVLMENRNGLIVDILVNEANGTAERDAALTMVERTVPGRRRITLGVDAGYDTKELVEDCRERNITPHFARRKHSTLDGRTTNHVGYEISRYKRMQTEKIFGWGKTTGGLRKTRFKGVVRNQMHAEVAGSAYNLLRIAKISRGRV